MFLDKPIAFTMLYILIIVALSFVLVITVIYIIVRMRIDKKRELEIKKAGLDKFIQGAVDSLNPDLGVDDQAELLPYDKKWEFPREKLKLGNTLKSRVCFDLTLDFLKASNLDPAPLVL